MLEDRQRQACATPGCTRTPVPTYCDGCLAARRAGGALMADIAAARPLLAPWHAISSRRSGQGSAWWWR